MSLVQIAAPQPRLPEWLREGRTDYRALHELKVELRSRHLHTVCESARCPNIHDCFGRGAATFMILGNICTRRCGFCAVPQGEPEYLDRDEPTQVADMAARMDLKYVVITSVNRDDLSDGGSGHFARTVRELRRRLPAAKVDSLLRRAMMSDPLVTNMSDADAILRELLAAERDALPAAWYT